MTNDNKFLNRLATGKPILADGAMGTMLHGKGIAFSQCFDALNISQPGVVAEVHRAYIDAGSEIILTNTFGANYYRLVKFGLENQVEEINQAGVDLARRVMLASFKEVLIGGDVGPLGVRIAPFGRVQLEQARAAFRAQIEALVSAGVDYIHLETFSDLYELLEAVRAVHEVCKLPILASMTFTRDDLTLLGTTPEQAARTLHEVGVTVIGLNCSIGPAQVMRLLGRMQTAVPEGKYSVMPNAGLPAQAQGRIMYPAMPAYFQDYAEAFRQAGVSVMGGCCGTTPEHIREMRLALDSPASETSLVVTSREPEQETGVSEPYAETQLAQRLKSGKFAFAVEMAPPRGINTRKIIAAASMLSEAGADVIDMADSPRARMRMSPWAVCNVIQSQLGTDTTLHFPTRGRNLLRVQGDLLAAHALNVRNIFVVMGDPTAIGDYPDAMDDYDVVPSGLIKLIKQGFNQGEDYAGSEIGQPTSFFVGCALNLIPKEIDQETKVLRRKLEAGADFALTQPVYEPDKAIQFIERYQEKYGKLDIFILAGILPLYNKRHAAFLHNEVPGIVIPEDLIDRLDKAGERASEEGIRIALETIAAIKPHVHGVYIMPPFSRYDRAAEIIEMVREWER